MKNSKHFLAVYKKRLRTLYFSVANCYNIKVLKGAFRGKENFFEIKLLKIREILKQDRDERRSLSDYRKVEIERRRTFYVDVATPNPHDYKATCKRGQHSKSYYAVDRNFDVSELRILRDVVQVQVVSIEKKTAE